MTATAKTASYGKASVTLTRMFDAPRALVWEAWTDPKMMAQWFGPRGFTNPVCELDVRVGGSLRIVMRGPDGQDYPMKGEFRQVVAPERLVFTNIATDNDGNHLLEGETTVTFTEKDGKTTLRVTAYAVGLVPIAPQMLAGRVGSRASTSWKLWSAVQDRWGLRHDAQALFPSAGVLLSQGAHRTLRTRHCLRADPCRSRRREIERGVPGAVAVGKIPGVA